ncbi:MAG TPA: (S)-ureidoglycine aminohydrolase [Gemmataceae bacterium]|jgi:(S)-ureidoglycine aminohydrolase|nr:(S)-ureidoglycine aminohydrolase [Gemmataceae bacterium]
MDLFGSTRSRVARDHALICPDSFVRAPLPGWSKAQGIMLIAPQMGARFTQFFALMESGGAAAPAAGGVERVLFVLEGSVVIQPPRAKEQVLTAGGYVYVPPDADMPLRAQTAARLNVFEKRYVPLGRVKPPSLVFGREEDVEGLPFHGDPNARLQTLLPDDPVFDLAMNVFTYQPGAALPQVEVHVMEHGLLMLDGQGVYRLGDDWYPARQGDVIWMAPYCPQWFVAMGKTPARYLYYKDVNRDPLGGER